MLSQTYLREIFSYCPATGTLTWLVDRGPISIGDVAGYKRDRYYTIGIDGRSYYAHVVVWIYVNGSYDPSEEIDHINGDGFDNRIGNLRLVSRRLNQNNRKSHRAGRLPGTSYIQGRKKPWRAQIQTEGKRINLGYYSSETEAHEAYLKAVKN
jgi:hypothetical protein